MGLRLSHLLPLDHVLRFTWRPQMRFEPLSDPKLRLRTDTCTAIHGDDDEVSDTIKPEEASSITGDERF
jgi:hypothetical protein